MYSHALRATMMSISSKASTSGCASPKHKCHKCTQCDPDRISQCRGVPSCVRTDAGPDDTEENHVDCECDDSGEHGERGGERHEDRPNSVVSNCAKETEEKCKTCESRTCEFARAQEHGVSLLQPDNITTLVPATNRLGARPGYK